MKKVLVIVAIFALAIAACGGSDDDSGAADNGGGDGGTAVVVAGDAAKGEELFTKTCVSCHGEAGVGIDGLGKPMPGSPFIAGLSDDELATFIKVGRSTSDPDNTTGVDMPAKGGNPSLSDEDIAHIVAYIRTLG